MASTCAGTVSCVSWIVTINELAEESFQTYEGQDNGFVISTKRCTSDPSGYATKKDQDDRQGSEDE